MEGHGRLFDLGALLGEIHRFGALQALAHVQQGGGHLRLAARRPAIQAMPRQAAIPTTGLGRIQRRPQRLAAALQGRGRLRIEHVQRRRRWPLADGAFNAADPERVAGIFQAAIGVAVGFTAIDQGQRADDFLRSRRLRGVTRLLAFGQRSATHFGNHHHLARHRRQGLARQGYDRRNGRAGDDLAIGQSPRARGRQATAQGKRLSVEIVVARLAYRQPRALFEDIMDAPHGPHALGEMRVEMAVIDRIADHPIAVAGPTMGDLVGVTGAWAYALCIHVVGVVIVGVEQPLVTMQMENMLLVTHADIANLHRIAQVAVGNVGRLGRIQRHAGLDTDTLGGRFLARRQQLEPYVGRHVHLHRDIAGGVRAEEEFFIGARQAVMHGADTHPVGDDLGAHATGTVVDHEGVAGRIEHLAEHGVAPEPWKRLDNCRLVMEHRSEIAEWLQAIGQAGVALALAFKGIGCRWEAAIGIGPHDHGVCIAGNDLAAVDHAEDRFAGLAFRDPGFKYRVASLVVDDRLAGRGAAAGGQAHLFFGDGVLISLPAFGQHHDLGEQAIADVAGRALATEGGAVTGRRERAFAFGVEGVGAALPRCQQGVVVAAAVGGNIVDRAKCL
ncbi:hypothetical protein D3C79_400440 [compost metagenome]